MMDLLKRLQITRMHRIMCFEIDDVVDVKLSKTSNIDRAGDMQVKAFYQHNLDKNDFDAFFAEHKVFLENGFQTSYTVRTNEELKKIIQNVNNRELSDLNWLDVSAITDFRGLFLHSTFKGDISKWDIPKDADCSYMFAFSEADNWDYMPQRLKDMYGDSTCQDRSYHIILECPLTQNHKK